jgi:lipopolysaccharide heptosyltransferase II
MQAKILIIKLGYSETLDSEIGRVVSLGDVLRATVILRALKQKYPDSHISWVVSEKAEPLLVQNEFIDRVLVWDQFVPFQLMREKFDILINLEKIPGVCAVADMIEAWTKYGFRFDSIKGSYDAYEKGLRFIDYIASKKSDKLKSAWQQVMVELLGGVEWNGQRYIIGYKPKTALMFDVGLNYQVGPKWPTKGMPVAAWRLLEKKLSAAGYKVSWQQGQGDLFEYMDWIYACRLLISSDSLGLHIAFAFDRKVVGLFGPTDPSEIYLYNESVVVRSDCGCKKMPCWSPGCLTGLNCMDHLDLDDIVAKVGVILDDARLQPCLENYAMG